MPPRARSQPPTTGPMASPKSWAVPPYSRYRPDGSAWAMTNMATGERKPVAKV